MTAKANTRNSRAGFACLGLALRGALTCASMKLVACYFSLQWPATQDTLASVLPLTSHFDSPQIPSHEGGSGTFALTALQLQQSAKMVQSASLVQVASGSGVAGAAAFSACLAVSSGTTAFGSASLVGAALAAGAEACCGVLPQAEIRKRTNGAKVLRLMMREDTGTCCVSKGETDL